MPSAWEKNLQRRQSPGLTRVTRAELTEVLTSEFLLLARTKGLTRQQAVIRHAMRNSMVPLIPGIRRSGVATAMRLSAFRYHAATFRRDIRPMSLRRLLLPLLLLCLSLPASAGLFDQQARRVASGTISRAEADNAERSPRDAGDGATIGVQLGRMAPPFAVAHVPVHADELA